MSEREALHLGKCTLSGGDSPLVPGTRAPRRLVSPPGCAARARGRGGAAGSWSGNGSPQLAGYPLHVKLPFDLRDPSVEIEAKVFPRTRSLGEFANRSYLNFEVEELPPGPWPLTIAGVPYTIGDINGRTGRGRLLPRKAAGNMRVRICGDLERGAPSSRQAFRLYADTITKAFSALLPDITVVECIATADTHMYVVLGDQVDISAVISRLPGQIGRMWTMDLGRPEPDALQALLLRTTTPDPANKIVDDTASVVLRPGVLLCSFVDGTHQTHNLITSGVAVQNVVGDSFMTTAAHGIGIDTMVYAGRPSITSDFRSVGEAVVELAFTDISLVALKSNVQFRNRLFDQREEESVRLTSIVGEDPNDDKVKIGDCVSMDTPFTGAISGSIMHKSWRLINEPPEHPVEKRLQYVVYDWVYNGERPPDQKLLVRAGYTLVRPE
ncbi:uncharacterized protein B0I36DRAFT_419873 [Microdochium trichocladiopsis]|uniref:Uncharacterized protein n=1 Tax=Microdochium trichocladiopsis TaxID=1682393 RepID=A0A9P8YJB1_9PEZI|nr:uncharacterized protein B0I36DRAFT_419873 [Microdochium trichocladiopsis]KAH7041048.1 hypothetical protein B0I36DRAFT_419873 [Microdochium trichocladiopsis]